MAAALTTFYQQRQDRYLSLKNATKAALAAAGDVLKLATDVYAQAVDQRAGLDAEIAATRAQMSLPGNMPADVESLAGQLRQLLIDRRHNAAALAEAAEALESAEAAVATEETSLQKLGALLTRAQADLAAAQRREARQDAWVAAETEDQISELRDLAADLLAENPITVAEGETNPADVLAAAGERIENDIPELLRDRARARAALAGARLGGLRGQRASMQGLLLSHGAASHGSSGLLAQREAQYRSAENDLKRYALGSTGSYDLALSQLASIGASRQLTQEERDRIDSLALADDADAITTEAALHDARAAVAEQELAVDLALVEARVADVNADPEADAAVIAARAELADRIALLEAAETAHTDEFENAIDLWEGAIPDAIWANLQAYDSAIGLLTALAGSDASPLVTALTDAEDALVAAAGADDDNVRLEQLLAASSSMAGLLAEHVERARRSLELSAMRGDY